MSSEHNRETIHGIIEEVMEVFPLRLLVRATSGRQYVQLEEDTEIVSPQGPRDARDLAIGQSVHVLGFPSGNLFIAREIKIE